MKSDAGDEYIRLEKATINADTDKKKQNKKSNLSAEFIETKPQYVSNSGIVLLHLFLDMYFAEFGLLQQKKFIT